VDFDDSEFDPIVQNFFARLPWDSSVKPWFSSFFSFHFGCFHEPRDEGFFPSLKP